MDEIEHFPFLLIPPKSLSLRLTRSAIPMRHDSRWRVDKSNTVHDLIIPLSGRGSYRIGGRDFTLEPGEALLVPAYTRFQGRSDGPDEYIGIAQHFMLDLFEKGDVIAQMRLKQKARFSDWSVFGPLLRHYRESSPRTWPTLPQHHHFMVILLDILSDGFLGWKQGEEAHEKQDHLSMQIMQVASQIGSDPLGDGLEDAISNVTYHPDYFRRAFRDRIGMTPQKFRELKRMEFAISRLDLGLSVKQVASELGYSDPYFFSRMFKRHIGEPPSIFRAQAGSVTRPDGGRA